MFFDTLWIIIYYTSHLNLFEAFLLLIDNLLIFITHVNLFLWFRSSLTLKNTPLKIKSLTIKITNKDQIPDRFSESLEASLESITIRYWTKEKLNNEPSGEEIFSFISYCQGICQVALKFSCNEISILHLMRKCPKDVSIYLGFLNWKRETLQNWEIYFIDRSTPCAQNTLEFERFDKSTLSEDEKLWGELKRPEKYYKVYASSLTIKNKSFNQENLTKGLIILNSQWVKSKYWGSEADIEQIKIGEISQINKHELSDEIVESLSQNGSESCVIK